MPPCSDMDEGCEVRIPMAMLMNASLVDETVDESFIDLEDKSFLCN